MESGATLDDFLLSAAEWRDDARQHPDGVALFYFVGLGIENPDGEQLCLLENFGDGIGPLLRGVITLSSVMNGMAPSPHHDGVARTQVYVMDASRRRPRGDLAFAWTNATTVFDAELVRIDDRALLTIYAAAAGSPAYAGEKRGSFRHRA